MITLSSGNLLEADAEALVNTVNCVGVMGKGIALQFSKKFPDMHKAYKEAHKAGELEPNVIGEGNPVWKTSNPVSML